MLHVGMFLPQADVAPGHSCAAARELSALPPMAFGGR